MVYTPYDWAQVLRQKADYVEDRLRLGSPVIAISYEMGVLIATVRGAQRKIYEVYDRLAFAALGQQADIEAVRMLAVDFAHVEGFQRSPEDVSIQRVVGFAVSPAVRRAFSDPFRTPFVVRGLFAQVGESTSEDTFIVLNYDGEFSQRERVAAIAGVIGVEGKMERFVNDHLESGSLPLDEVLQIALMAWALGKVEAEGNAPSETEEREVSQDILGDTLKRNLMEGKVEAVLLERHSMNERRFKLLTDDQIEPALERLRI
ncbi:MAG: hypothetical protein RMK18_12205 [Armatimonadota bacterium]|nr:hypothetical protein [Armatimonadota bacterium]MDW8026608.1 hypothetical protein [Armatimonadota bacterium]